MTLGSLHLFITPRQLHFLYKFHEIFLADDPPREDPTSQSAMHRNEAIRRYNQDGSRASVVSEDTLHSDGRRSAQRRLGMMGGGLRSSQGWSSDQYSESPSHQPSPHHYSHSARQSHMTDSIYSTSSMTSSMCSSASQSTHAASRSRRRGIIDADPNADVSHMNIRVACLAVILLHEDILVESVLDYPLASESVDRLRLLASTFFDTIAPLHIGLGQDDMKKADKLMLQSCSQSHLRLLVAPIIVEGEEQRNTIGDLLRLTVSMAHVDFREVLQNGLTTPLLEFPVHMV